MGLLGLLTGKQRVQFIQNNSTVIQLDASIAEKHHRKSTPTKFPVENGQTISDHMILEPFDLELTGIISDTPLGTAGQLLTEVATTLTSRLIPPAGLVAAAGAFGVGSALFSALAGSSSPSVAAYGRLLQLQEAAQPFDVLTSLARYSNMWISDITAPRSAGDGNILIFTVQLVELNLVTPQQVNIQIFANPALAANQADMGEQGMNLSAKYQQGFTDSNTAVHSVAGSAGIAGGAK